MYIERREWRWKWFKWLKWPRCVEQTIDITFNKEVGEGSGSHKGGTIGCGYKMLPNESALQCLRRMEVERNF